MRITLQTIDYALLQQCMHCGMCLPTCPTYDATGRERNSPRGRIALMRAIADRDLELTAAFADEMSYCLGCLACQTACPAGVNYGALFETARSHIQASGVDRSPRRRFWRAMTLRFLFMRPRALRAAGRVLGAAQRSGLVGLARRLRVTRLLPADLRRVEPQAPVMARHFSNALIRPREAPAGRVRHQVALLTGCVQDLVFPDINRDTADVLLANGCAVDTPAEQPCCGSLHAHNGETELAAALARRMIDLVPPERYDAIVTNAGGCGSHLRHYTPLLAGDPQYRDRARAWDAKVRDIHEWLVEIGFRRPAAAPFDTGTAVTYHESCHLVHGQKISRQPRTVLESLPGVTLTELPEASWCCGSAGIYALTQPAQADALLRRKVGNIRITGAPLVATANPGCHMQIARGLGDEGVPVRVLHPVSILARAYRREQGEDHILRDR
jgi:glycolate oxidase iron-sulfur subunit